MPQQTLTGMVIASQNINETDRRIVLLTRERGRISAFARGAVKPKSPLVAATQSFTFGEYYAFVNRDSYTVTGAEIGKYFDFVRQDIDKYYYASYMCELATYYTQENLDAEDILLLLYQSFRALEKDTIENELIRRIYEWRMLLINGEAPNVFRCMKCSRDYKDIPTDEQIYFSVSGHGLICGACQSKAVDLIPVQRGTIHAIQFILSTPIKKLYTFRLSEEILNELCLVTDRYLKSVVNYQFNSLLFLDIG